MATRYEPTLVGVLNVSPESMVAESVATTYRGADVLELPHI